MSFVFEADHQTTEGYSMAVRDMVCHGASSKPTWSFMERAPSRPGARTVGHRWCHIASSISEFVSQLISSLVGRPFHSKGMPMNESINGDAGRPTENMGGACGGGSPRHVNGGFGERGGAPPLAHSECKHHPTEWQASRDDYATNPEPIAGLHHLFLSSLHS